MDSTAQSQDAAGALPLGMDANGASAMDTSFANQADPEAVAAMMAAGQTFMPTGGIGGGIPMGDGAFMMPLMMPNGAALQIPQNLVSAGKKHSLVRKALSR